MARGQFTLRQWFAAVTIAFIVAAIFRRPITYLLPELFYGIRWEWALWPAYTAGYIEDGWMRNSIARTGHTGEFSDVLTDMLSCVWFAVTTFVYLCILFGIVDTIWTWAKRKETDDAT